jgi:diguanylate cyclase (GGDEF)-like protein
VLPGLLTIEGANGLLALSIAAIDVGFRQVNDSHGHAEGDRVPVDLVRRAGAMVRDIDCFARLGGEEVALPLPYCDTAAGMQVAQRLRQLLEQPEPGA